MRERVIHKHKHQPRLKWGTTQHQKKCAGHFPRLPALCAQWRRPSRRPSQRNAESAGLCTLLLLAVPSAPGSGAVLWKEVPASRSVARAPSLASSLAPTTGLVIFPCQANFLADTDINIDFC